MTECINRGIVETADDCHDQLCAYAKYQLLSEYDITQLFSTITAMIDQDDSGNLLPAPLPLQHQNNQ